MIDKLLPSIYTAPASYKALNLSNCYNTPEMSYHDDSTRLFPVCSTALISAEVSATNLLKDTG